MSALEDSQENVPVAVPGDEQDHSQDLFAPPENPAGASAGSKEILNKLVKMEKILQELSADVLYLKRQSEQKGQSFLMEECSFKKKLNTYLREKFSANPWLNTTSDIGFKNEVKSHLDKEGFKGQGHAFKMVVQWSASKFTDYRNQLRRKISLDIKSGKDVQAMELDEFSKVFLGPFCNSSDVLAPKRRQLSLLLRSFLNKHKLNTNGSDEVEFFLDFWGKFKDYFGEIQVINDPEKWKVLQELDSRRTKRRQEPAV
ncbi:uncharacterized protein LOC143049682 [Mytilus galloprovincialis]|uniref:uncharacterized protein LOC143049682 n=1 Tax=Mytilus galloprovincialis TaxID=29158 RepID=UPI003F7B842B